MKGYLFLVVNAANVAFTFTKGSKIGTGSNPHDGTREGVEKQIAAFRKQFADRCGDEIRNDSEISLA